MYMTLNFCHNHLSSKYLVWIDCVDSVFWPSSSFVTRHVCFCLWLWLWIVFMTINYSEAYPFCWLFAVVSGQGNNLSLVYVLRPIIGPVYCWLACRKSFFIWIDGCCTNFLTISAFFMVLHCFYGLHVILCLFIRKFSPKNIRKTPENNKIFAKIWRSVFYSKHFHHSVMSSAISAWTRLSVTVIFVWIKSNWYKNELTFRKGFNPLQN